MSTTEPEADAAAVQPMTLRLTREAREALDEIISRRGLRYVAVAVEVLAREERARLRGARS
ncbi:MAG: hypothetical protein ACO3GM_05400 [Candidatus Limnocylindrus sp.]